MSALFVFSQRQNFPAVSDARSRFVGQVLVDNAASLNSASVKLINSGG
jgi:hypothetical protein